MGGRRGSAGDRTEAEGGDQRGRAALGLGRLIEEAFVGLGRDRVISSSHVCAWKLFRAVQGEEYLSAVAYLSSLFDSERASDGLLEKSRGAAGSGTRCALQKK